MKGKKGDWKLSGEWDYVQWEKKRGIKNRKRYTKLGLCELISSEKVIGLIC